MNNSLAVAYNMKKKAKKMADGGTVPEPNKKNAAEMQKGATSSGMISVSDALSNIKSGLGMAHGGELHDDDIVDRVMRKKCSEGGQVANETPIVADFEPNEFDDLVLRDELEGVNSGAADGDLLGDAQEDSDRKDMVSRIMRQRSMKQRNPSPA